MATSGVSERPYTGKRSSNNIIYTNSVALRHAVKPLFFAVDNRTLQLPHHPARHPDSNAV